MIFLLLSIILTAPCYGVKSVMEGIVSSNATILVDTVSARVDVSTDGYRGAVANVGLFTSSNVVVSNGASSCVIYATGSVTCLGVALGSPTISTTTVRGVVDNFISSVNGSATSFSLTQTPSSTSSVHLVLDGLTLYNPDDYSLSGVSITMVTAPSASSSEFYAFYDVITSTIPGAITSGSVAGGDLSGTYPIPKVAGSSNSGGFAVTVAQTNSSTLIVGGSVISIAGDIFEVQSGSASVSGIFHIGLSQVTNACTLATTCKASCSSGSYVISGGCLNGTLTVGVSGSYPDSLTSWTCDPTAAVNITAYAVCSRISN